MSNTTSAHWDEYDLKPGDGASNSLTRFTYDWPELTRHFTDVLGGRLSRRSSAEWAGGDASDVQRLLTDGDQAGVEKAEQLLSEINTQIDVEDLGVVLGFAPMGSSVSIGHYLAGVPSCMRKMVEAESDHCPIRLFVGLASSASCSTDVMRKRGVACVALAMALSRIRPVELWGYTASRPNSKKIHRKHGQESIDTCIMVRIGMTPFDMSIASALFTQPIMTRGLAYAIAADYAGDLDNAGLDWTYRADKDAVGASPVDVVVPQMRMDNAERVWDNPVKWVQEQLELALKNQGEAMRLGLGTATEYASDYRK